MKCKWKDCDNEAKGKGFYCSGACRTNASRASRATVSPAPVPSVSRDTVGVDYVTVDGRCYNRQAVECREFGTRPEPLDATDQPVPNNRGRYRCVDGTVYQFDSQGRSLECKHPFYDRVGVKHLAVHETVADVRAAAGACL